MRVTGAEDFRFGVVQDGQEFFEEAGAAFRGELIVEAPEAGAELGEEGVDVFAGGHPGNVSGWGFVEGDG